MKFNMSYFIFLYQIENLNNLGTEVVCVAVDKEKDAMFKTCSIIGDQWLERDKSLQKFRDFVGMIYC